MEYSFQNIYFLFSLILLITAFIRYRRHGRVGPSIFAVMGYWVLASMFFYKAVWHGLFLVPGDNLFWFYPWKTWAVSDRAHNPLLGDAVCNFYPWMAFLKSAIAKGVLPLWNFHSYSGSPLMANLASAQFNPLNFFLIFMDVPDFSTWLPFIRLVISGTGTFFFLRVLKVSPMASFFGGVLFSCCGVNIVWLSNYPNISVIMFLPWVMICMEKIAAGKGRVWFCVLVVCSVAQFLGGHPESSFHLYLYAGAYFIWRLYGFGKSGTDLKEILKRGGVASCAGIIAMGLVAFQLLPFLEYLPHTTRYYEIVEQGNNIFGSFGFFDVVKLIVGTLINPDFFGNPVDGNYWEFANYNEQNAYFSVAGLFLCLVGMMGKGAGRKRVFFIVIALISFSIITRLPLIHEFVNSLPGFSMAANYRLIFAMVFSLVILAGFGMDALGDARGIKPYCLMAIIFIPAAAAVAVHLFAPPEASLMDYRLQRLARFFLLLVGVAALSLATWYSRKMISWFPFLAVILVVGDLGYHGIDYNTFMEKKNIFPQTPLTRFLSREQGHSRIIGWHGCLLGGVEHVYEYDSITGYDPMKIHAYEKIMAMINGSYNPVFTSEIQSLESPWIHFLGVGYVATPPGLEDDLFSSNGFDLVYNGQDGRVYANKNAFPRAFWGKNPIPAEDQDNAFDLMGRDGFSPLSSTVVETGGIGPGFRAGAGNTPPVIEKMEGNEIRVGIEEGSGLLVVSEVWFPGWKAHVDGKRREILRVNGAFMGVLISSGEKEMKLEFCPDSFKQGVWISCCSLLACLLLGRWVVNKQPSNHPAEGGKHV